ncbi:MAG: VOC family protein [Cupriavidus necator]
MTIHLDHLFVPSRNMRNSATLLANLLGVPCEQGREGPFFAVYVNEGLTLDFIETQEQFPYHHYCFRVTQDDFNAILGRIQAAGIKYGSEPGSEDMQINTRSGGSNIYWSEPDGHRWEMLTISYARRAP